MAKQAFIVTGAEHSGNRLMVGLLVSGGIWGKPSDKQPRPGNIPYPIPDDVAVIAHVYEDLDAWATYWLQEHDVKVIVMVRDPWVQMRSRAKAANKSRAEGALRYDSDYKAAFRVIVERNLPFILVPYECLLWRGSSERILGLLGLKQIQPLIVQGKVTEIRDENGKWYAGL